MLYIKGPRVVPEERRLRSISAVVMVCSGLKGKAVGLGNHKDVAILMPIALWVSQLI